MVSGTPESWRTEQECPHGRRKGQSQKIRSHKQGVKFYLGLNAPCGTPPLSESTLRLQTRQRFPREAAKLWELHCSCCSHSLWKLACAVSWVKASAVSTELYLREAGCGLRTCDVTARQPDLDFRILRGGVVLRPVISPLFLQLLES